MEILDLYHHPYSRHLSIIVTSIACILVSIYFLEIGYTIIFQNLFYVPIILACAIYIFDVTEMYQYEIEQNRSMEQIQKNMAQLAVLNDGIRNPLTVIMFIAGTYLEDQMYCQIIEQADIINDIVNQLDRRWVESEAVLKFLRKHDDIFVSPQMRSETTKCDDIRYN